MPIGTEHYSTCHASHKKIHDIYFHVILHIYRERISHYVCVYFVFWALVALQHGMTLMEYHEPMSLWAGPLCIVYHNILDTWKWNTYFFFRQLSVAFAADTITPEWSTNIFPYTHCGMLAVRKSEKKCLDVILDIFWDKNVNDDSSNHIFSISHSTNKNTVEKSINCLLYMIFLIKNEYFVVKMNRFITQWDRLSKTRFLTRDPSNPAKVWKENGRDYEGLRWLYSIVGTISITTTGMKKIKQRLRRCHILDHNDRNKKETHNSNDRSTVCSFSGMRRRWRV